ncbi:MAG TPA: aconitate hydratase AcnA, partial [bacterium]|nr:aconitate hydratase AcnA [bacterium]
KEDIEALAKWSGGKGEEREISFYVARVLMQDFTGVPCVVDLASMREALKKMGGDPAKVNPLRPAELVIDHSVQVDKAGTLAAFGINARLENERNKERYALLKWGQTAFNGFTVVPPDTGIVHQVNIENLARVVFSETIDGKTFAFPDTVVGTDSHTTMVNGLGVVGWGVGGIEAEACMLGEATPMLIPEVVGFKLTGKLPEGATATDLVLTCTEMLRKKEVVGKFVEYYGPGVGALSLPDRATVANMAPEYGSTIGFFPVDEETLAYLKLTGRDPERIALVEAYSRAQGMWRKDAMPDPTFTETIELDLGTVVPSLAGPKRPEVRIPLKESKARFAKDLKESVKEDKSGGGVPVDALGGGVEFRLKHGDVVIAAITSCTNTSNPAVLVGAGILAKKAIERGLKAKPWVKTSLAPGSQVVTDYLAEAGLTPYLEGLGFHLVGYGCTTCIGNSGPLPEPIVNAITKGELAVSGVLSGNRNFEGRIHPNVRLNYLASPPLVVAYAIAGTMNIDLQNEPIGVSLDGDKVFLKDIWPTAEEIRAATQKAVRPDQFKKVYARVFEGDAVWKSIPATKSQLFAWDEKSTYVRNPPYFDGMPAKPETVADVKNARPLALFAADNAISTDHISPAGDISAKGAAGEFLKAKGIAKSDFNSFGARRGNHEVMMRGTFGNIRLKNALLKGAEGADTIFQPSGEKMSIFDASMKYQAAKTPLVILAGKLYGNGSSRDWAAKGTLLLGVKAVVAVSFERIHRSNLVGMGVLPLEFTGGETWEKLGIDGSETFDITGLSELKPRQTVKVSFTKGGVTKTFNTTCRIDTPKEMEYFRNGGILQYVLRKMAASK